MRFVHDNQPSGLIAFPVMQARQVEVEAIAYLFEGALDRVIRGDRLFIHGHGKCANTPMRVLQEVEASFDELKTFPTDRPFPGRHASGRHDACVKLDIAARPDAQRRNVSISLGNQMMDLPFENRDPGKDEIAFVGISNRA